MAQEARAQPASGNRWYAKGDNVLGPLGVSAKAETGRSWTSTRRQLREAADMFVGTGLLPALAVLDDDGEELAVLRLSDLVAALSTEPVLTRSESNGEVRRRALDAPALLREAS
jgi:hypothetical protein